MTPEESQHYANLLTIIEANPHHSGKFSHLASEAMAEIMAADAKLKEAAVARAKEAQAEQAEAAGPSGNTDLQSEDDEAEATPRNADREALRYRGADAVTKADGARRR